jgi:uncharacterized RDD family membrane protein YckC
MTAPADAALPEPAPAGAAAPEPALADTALSEPELADASPPESTPAAGALPQAVPADAGRPEPASAAAALTESAPRDGSTAPGALGIPQHLRGHYAGFASRFGAFVVDCIVSYVIFLLALGAISFTASVLTGSSIHWSRDNTWVVIAFFAWEFIYYAYFWTSSGKTPGMFLLGVQVVGQDGSHVGTKRGLVRTLAFPLSFITLGLGFLGILLGSDRHALHDVIAGTAVVYCWDAREARLRSLARQETGRRHKSNAGSRPS